MLHCPLNKKAGPFTWSILQSEIGPVFQVDLSDSEADEADQPEAAEAKEDAMGRRRAGDLGVSKKGTPLYSREDIREQYCINDKELQVLDKSGRKGILGCFSNNGQVSCNEWPQMVLGPFLPLAAKSYCCSQNSSFGGKNFRLSFWCARLKETLLLKSGGYHTEPKVLYAQQKS